MIEFLNYHNKYLNRILKLTIDGVITWKIVESMDGKRYRGKGNNHIFVVRVFDNKDNYIAYIQKNIKNIESSWEFVFENQLIIDCFINKLIDFIETKKYWLSVYKHRNKFIDIETGEIIINDDIEQAKNEFDYMCISKTYRALNNYASSI